MRPRLAFAHIGDLHLTTAEAPNARDFRAIVRQLNEVEGLDFVYLPGDNADQGRAEQYRLLRAGLDALRTPAHVITGDHDMEGGDLSPFYAELGVPRLPYAIEAGGTRCLFLDMSGPGAGGPDFRLGAEQLAWLEGRLAEAERDGATCAVFMHSYPADLRGDGEAERVAALLHRAPVRLVEMGHTHYNELAHDGRTIYAATRSTGQIEEGPVGFALVAIDGDAVSWRFKALARPWPFAMVTSPADGRLALPAAEAPDATPILRGLVLSPEPVAHCEGRCDDGPWTRMTRIGRGPFFEAPIPGFHRAERVAIRAVDQAGRVAEDVVEPRRSPPPRPSPSAEARLGSDAFAIGAWAEIGLLGTQLGPNRNGRKW